MKFTFAALLTIASSTAFALPPSTLYFEKVTHELDPGVSYYVAYGTRPEPNKKKIGSKVVPMTETVADQLLALPTNELVECEAKAFHADRELLTYSLACR